MSHSNREIAELILIYAIQGNEGMREQLLSGDFENDWATAGITGLLRNATLNGRTVDRLSHYQNMFLADDSLMSAAEITRTRAIDPMWGEKPCPDATYLKAALDAMLAIAETD